MFVDSFFVEFSPIQLPYDSLPERSQFFLDEDLSFFILFILHSLIIFFRVLKEVRKEKEVKKNFLSSDSLERKTWFLVILSFVLIGWVGIPYPEIASCDGRNAFSPPPSPVPLPEEPVTPPEAPPVPQPVVIPQLAQPLIGDDSRRSLLYNRYLFLNFGGNDDLRRMVSILDAQVIVERHVEAALVHDGFHPHSILARYVEIRGLLHSPQGELLSERTYHSYVTQI